MKIEPLLDCIRREWTQLPQRPGSILPISPAADAMKPAYPKARSQIGCAIYQTSQR